MKAASGYRSAFTLIELLITIPLAAFLIVVVVRTYIACARMIDSQRIRNNLNGSVRICSDYITRDASMAGYGLQGAVDDGLQNWITWESGVTHPVLLDDGTGTQPDTLRLCGAFERSSKLETAVSAGDQVITIDSDDISKFNTTNKCLIYIGRTELARITATNGNQLTISTDYSANQGLRYAFPSNAPIELVQVITYFVTNTPEYSYLVRDDSAVEATYFGYWIPRNDVLATDIEGLQGTYTNNCLTVTVEGKSDEPDRTYKDPEFEDNFRRKSLTTKTFVRNL